MPRCVAISPYQPSDRVGNIFDSSLGVSFSEIAMSYRGISTY